MAPVKNQGSVPRCKDVPVDSEWAFNVVRPVLISIARRCGSAVHSVCPLSQSCASNASDCTSFWWKGTLLPSVLLRLLRCPLASSSPAQNARMRRGFAVCIQAVKRGFPPMRAHFARATFSRVWRKTELQGSRPSCRHKTESQTQCEANGVLLKSKCLSLSSIMSHSHSTSMCVCFVARRKCKSSAFRETVRARILQK